MDKAMLAMMLARQVPRLFAAIRAQGGLESFPNITNALNSGMDPGIMQDKLVNINGKLNEMAENSISRTAFNPVDFLDAQYPINDDLTMASDILGAERNVPNFSMVPGVTAPFDSQGLGISENDNIRDAILGHGTPEKAADAAAGFLMNGFPDEAAQARQDLDWQFADGIDYEPAREKFIRDNNLRSEVQPYTAKDWFREHGYADSEDFEWDPITGKLIKKK